MRIIIPNGLYHVSVRINNHYRWFEKEKYCQLYLATLLEEKKKNKFKIFSFCLMPTHDHNIFQTNDAIAPLDKVMHSLNGKFAKLFHKITGQRGHFWRSRYSSRPVSSRQDFLNVLKYIADNPVKAEITTDALGHKYNSIRNLFTGEFQEILDPLPDDIATKLREDYMIYKAKTVMVPSTSRTS
jgi:putative transposase